MAKKDKENTKVKVQKNVELTSALVTEINEMETGQRIRVTPLAHSIQLYSGSHPHVETVKGKLMEASLWQDVTKNLKFYKEDGQVYEIEKIEAIETTDVNLLIKKEVRSDLQVLKNKVDKIEHDLKKFKESLDAKNKNDVSMTYKLERIESALNELLGKKEVKHE